MHFALPFLQAVFFLQASEMIKASLAFGFYRSLDKEWALLSAGLRKMDNFKLIFTMYFDEKVEEQINIHGSLLIGALKLKSGAEKPKRKS